MGAVEWFWLGYGIAVLVLLVGGPIACALGWIEFDDDTL